MSSYHSYGVLVFRRLRATDVGKEKYLFLLKADPVYLVDTSVV